MSRGWTTYTIQPSKDTDPDDKNAGNNSSVKTGDYTRPFMLLIIMAGSLAVICIFGYRWARKKNH